ncbi:hypothetical protein OU994_19080 [Pseudoduganella sp. SL102]|uniref:hypothetical protein n=1 Tax=Pseudoduganella sp. SL102 TaxID=2995154 RepID=UPI00248C793D|nr:hypothetical protein [Pseudoduganella sp. SL102]WBS00412.1 hypothetical protein OU994_19080 [Pseudoduganella sp. SL102]
MIPFLCFHLAPQFYFPFSGAVSQAIDPDITWFQNLIRPGAGNARIERRAFEEVASYGKQLGLITEVLLEQAARADGEDSEAVRKLRAMQLQIEGIKAQEYGLADQALVARVIQALRNGGPELAVLARQTVPAIEPGPQPVEQP